jgi:hypothetical protein
MLNVSVGICTRILALIFGRYEESITNARLRADARGRDGGVREELTKGIAMIKSSRGESYASISGRL